MRKTGASTTSPSRYVAIDGLRFIAAMGVVAHHYVGLAGVPALEPLFAKNYLFVDFFFAISGFVIFHNYGTRIRDVSDYMDFLRNRLGRVYPLHLLTFAMFLGLALTVWRDKADRSFVDPATILPNLSLVHAWGTTHATSFNYPSWSISAEWAAYLSFPAVAWLIARGGARAALLVAAAIVIVLEAKGFVGVLPRWTTLTYQFGALRALPTFLFGAALAHSLARFPPFLRTFAPAWLCFGSAVLAMMAGLDDRWILTMLMASLVATVVAERDGATGVLTRPFMARLGDLSYAIYMIHPLVAIVGVNFLGVKLLHLSGVELAVWCFACAIAPNVWLASLANDWIESPARRWVRKPIWPWSHSPIRLGESLPPARNASPRAAFVR